MKTLRNISETENIAHFSLFLDSAHSYLTSQSSLKQRRPMRFIIPSNLWPVQKSGVPPGSPQLAYLRHPSACSSIFGVNEEPARHREVVL